MDNRQLELLQKLHEQVQKSNLNEISKVLAHCNISMKMAESELNDLQNNYHHKDRRNQKIVDTVGMMKYELRLKEFEIYKRPSGFNNQDLIET